MAGVRPPFREAHVSKDGQYFTQFNFRVRLLLQPIIFPFEPPHPNLGGFKRKNNFQHVNQGPNFLMETVNSNIGRDILTWLLFA